MEDTSQNLADPETDVFVDQDGIARNQDELNAWLARADGSARDPEAWTWLHNRADTHPDPAKRAQLRGTILGHRRSIREKRPENYSPPRDLDELNARVKAGEAFFEEMDLSLDFFANPIDLEACNMSKSTFGPAHLMDKTRLADALFRSCDFTKCKFGPGTDAARADFSKSDFRDVTFRDGANIHRASFEDCSFSDGSAVRFDRNRVFRADIRQARSDWNILWRAFTGVEQVLNIVFCLGYFAMIIAKIFAFSALGAFQSMALAQPGVAEANARFGVLENAVPVWQMVFGGATPTVYSVGVAGIILIYQIGRYRLTRRIAPLIENEKSEGNTPARADYDGLLKQHRRLQILGVIALAAFSIDLAFALFGIVYPINWAVFAPG